MPAHAWVKASTRTPASGGSAAADSSDCGKGSGKPYSARKSAPCSSSSGAWRTSAQGVSERLAQGPDARTRRPVHLRFDDELPRVQLLALSQFRGVLHDAGEAPQAGKPMEQLPLVARRRRPRKRVPHGPGVLRVAPVHGFVDRIVRQFVEPEELHRFRPPRPVAEAEVDRAVRRVPEGRRIPAAPPTAGSVRETVAANEDAEDRPRGIGQRERLELAHVDALARPRYAGSAGAPRRPPRVRQRRRCSRPGGPATAGAARRPAG